MARVIGSVRRRGALTSVEDGIHGVVAVALLLMMFLVTLEAITRYLFGSPFRGVLPITELFLMPVVVFLSWSAAQREGKHISVDILQHRMGKRMRRATAILVLALSLALMALVTWTAYDLTLDHWGTKTVAQPSLPVGPSRALVVLGGSLMVFRLTWQLLQAVMGRERASDQGQDQPRAF